MGWGCELAPKTSEGELVLHLIFQVRERKIMPLSPTSPPLSIANGRVGPEVTRTEELALHLAACTLGEPPGNAGEFFSGGEDEGKMAG